jgi:uncharacterized membrane protein
MWFLGLLLGAVIGAIGGGEGALVGAVIGGLATAIVRMGQGRLRGRIDDLESRLAELKDRLDRLDRAEPPPQPQPEPEPTPVEPAPEPPPLPPLPEPPPPGPPIPAPWTPWNWFLEGTAVVRLGVVILFIGVAFLVKYASDHVDVPIEARLAAVALGAVALLALGWRLRESRPGYALVVEGGGVGVLYLTVFAAFRLYRLLPGGGAFALLVAIGGLSATLAVVQNSPTLATIGVAGGFLAPILASTGGGSHAALFGFYAVLNASILGIAWFRPWRQLNLLGFAFTFCIGLAWGYRFYRPDHFTTTEPFLVLFFLFYVAIAVLFAIRQGATVRNPMDATLVFAVPVAAFALQTRLVREIEFGAAFSAVAVGAVYLGLSRWLFNRGGVALLAESFLALGVAFATLAIPLAVDGRWTAAAWAMEGAAIMWAGLRQTRLRVIVPGILLQFGAGIAFLSRVDGPRGDWPVLNNFVLGCALIAAAGLFSSWCLERSGEVAPALAKVAAPALFAWGCLWWLGGGIAEIDHRVARANHTHAAVLFVAASSAAFSYLHRRADWRLARFAALVAVPAMALGTLSSLSSSNHPFHSLGVVAWPVAILATLWILHRHAESRAADWGHTLTLWSATLLLGAEATWWAREWIQGGEGWRAATRPVVWIVVLASLLGWAGKLPWPVLRHPAAYSMFGPAGISAALTAWLLASNIGNDGSARPLPYVPILNPLDIASAAALLAVTAWVVRSGLRAGWLRGALAGVAFVWLSSALLRTIHHWKDIDFEWRALVGSMLVQASLSIFWSLLALAAMLVATRRGARPAWIGGAALLGIVVVKLFVVDLSNVGGVERIVSFLGVGVLLLVVGYFAPVPPAGKGGQS